LEGDDEDTTVRARQEALNTRHPFGLPIWKPALYKKSRSVTRAAFLALHARPLRSETLYLKPGNIAWMLLAGWWLMLVSMAIAVVLFFVPFGGSSYSRVARGLGWYLFWPFGRYVERIKDNVHSLNRCTLSSVDVTSGASALEAGAGAGAGAGAADQDGDEDAPLLGHLAAGPASNAETRHAQFRRKTALGRAVYYTLLVTLLNPVLILVSALSWFAVFSIPMGKLTHTLSRYLWRDPLSLHFRSGDLPTVQPAPTVLLCTNEAVGWYYYKYTVDGVNILFYNMLSVAAFVLVAAFIIAPLTHHQHFLVQPGVLFPLCLISTVPLAYFIGQAVSSISAQSSLGMGAVINATFGSIVEVILYCIALTQGKARLVEGALIGSLLAGLMLMPGTSMIAGGIKHKVQRFNAKSAEVTATLIIMSIIGAFAPTLFYHTFAVPEFECQDEAATAGDMVRRCKQVHLDIINDPFYLETVKPFMYVCAAILPLAYLIALWFSLKTHVKHIYSSGQTSNPIGVAHGVESSEGGGGHDAPNWSKFKSAFILCVCTVMFALIAEVLVDTVDVVIQKLGIKEKYVGLTLFALVPNVTEFMNAIAFAMQNNIALSIEISNAYTVQVALLQIPILVFFSAFYGVPDFVRHLPTDPGAYVFALIFPRWDLIAIFFCVFLLTYMLIEGRANYFKGSILCLSYFVWMVSYTFEPTRS
ncbi:hypothetical protein GQ54DRAFT_253752, partial [Martensiomyces pterosporus]